MYSHQKKTPRSEHEIAGYNPGQTPTACSGRARTVLSAARTTEPNSFHVEGSRSHVSLISIFRSIWTIDF